MINNVQNSQYQFGTNKQSSIKPLPSNSKIVKNNILTAPRTMLEDIKYDFKSFKKGVKGDAGDYELGRLNDVGMKFGGLLMTIFLMSKEPTFQKKLGPLIGVSAFFASMALWPKLALQLPAKLIHGFNIMEEYQDNYGRKKPFYQDNQFIPWDLYSDEYINKVGDKLNVSKDMPNRRDFIQEKMRKIALQNNTMWMLTAGFATPIMASLISHKLQPTLNNIRLSSIKKAVLGDSSGKYAENNVKKVQEFVNDYTQNLKNDILNLFNFNSLEIRKAKNSREACMRVIKEKIKNVDADNKLEERIADLINLEEKISDKTANKVLKDTKADFIKLLHLSKNKNISEDILEELIDNSSNYYKDIFNDSFANINYKNAAKTLFKPKETGIKNEKVEKAYREYLNKISDGIENDSQTDTVQATNTLINGIAQEKFNNKMWLNRVGAVGGGVLLTTLLSQFFFGKMEEK